MLLALTAKRHMRPSWVSYLVVSYFRSRETIELVVCCTVAEDVDMRQLSMKKTRFVEKLKSWVNCDVEQNQETLHLRSMFRQSAATAQSGRTITVGEGWMLWGKEERDGNDGKWRKNRKLKPGKQT